MRYDDKVIVPTEYDRRCRLCKGKKFLVTRNQEGQKVTQPCHGCQSKKKVWTK
jgi:hypothetical protein